MHLVLIDPWCTTHPTLKEYTGPGRRNRIDYCFLSAALFHDSLSNIAHDHQIKLHFADHLPITFRLQHPEFFKQSRLPWKCPSWLFQVPEVEATLKASLADFTARLRNGLLDNHGAFYDQHKPDDLRYFRYMFRLITTKCTAEIHHTRTRLHQLQHALTTQPPKAADARRRYTFNLTEKLITVNAHSAQRADNTVTTDSKDMAPAHTTYWADVFQYPSKDYRHAKRDIDAAAMRDILRRTTPSLSPDARAYFDAPLTANDYY
uniref:AlNc14C526G12048 protein n=1 Tax=Albugo laibachii Nc14 TaxID=890382 RepID=F0X0V8_9STRA|nr:AlNc14C526G12048 [Albugo laibachii Nc14]|eukprot:CCA27403.1 AlNc14C526G12048 [Albugo laibachii Nc14]